MDVLRPLLEMTVSKARLLGSMQPRSQSTRTMVAVWIFFLDHVDDKHALGF